MITNGGVGNEDADMAECDGEKVVTMMDVLQEEQDFEDDANAVLGASDEKNCTYSKGYIKRQAIYACLTCCTEAKYDPTKRAGVCLACSLNCHENHELVELYTKRNFCCDCGNPKFNSHPCQFTPNKNDLNEDNNYNQNFSGLYCRCHRPYPDPDSTIDDDEMIQCIICEDWLHASHLDTAVPAIDQYSEMVCKACMEKNEFLHDYSHLAVNIEVHDVDIEVNGTDTKLSNVKLNTEKLINGTDDTSIDTAERPSDNMDVDKALIEDNSPTEKEGNKDNAITPQISVEESNEKDSDITMAAENTKESSDVNTKTENSKADISAEQPPNPSGDTLTESTSMTEEKPDEIANVTSEEKPKVTSEEETTKITSEEKTTKVTSEEETTKVTSEGETTKVTMQELISESKESKETLLENAEESKHSQESEDTKMEENEIGDVVSGKPEESTELSENKSEMVEKTSENDPGDEASKIDSNETKEDENTSTTTGDAELKTNNAENDNEINGSNKETPNTENTDLPQGDITNKADSMETDKISSDVVSESVINEDESNETASYVNKDDNSEAKIEEPNETENMITEIKEMKRKLSTEDTAVADDHLVKKPKFNEETCIRPNGVKRVYNGATFWPSHLRQKLCTCSVCVSMYKDLSVLFLIDPEDTVLAYETLGKERINGRATQYEKGLEALSSLDRIQQINALTEYNKMRDKLLDFLKSFKDRKEVVKEEDIKAFFAGMKPKREPDGVYFCR